MLSEQEWALMEPALMHRIEDIQRHRAATGDGLEAALAARRSDALELYRRLTGFHETNIDAIWHHRVSLYGPPCTNCGKPLRTPQAGYCPACGARREQALDTSAPSGASKD